MSFTVTPVTLYERIRMTPKILQIFAQYLSNSVIDVEYSCDVHVYCCILTMKLVA